MESTEETMLAGVLRARQKQRQVIQESSQQFAAAAVAFLQDPSNVCLSGVLSMLGSADGAPADGFSSRVCVSSLARAFVRSCVCSYVCVYRYCVHVCMYFCV